MKKCLKNLICILLLLIIVCPYAKAESPFDSYVYNKEGDAVRAPEAVTLEKTVYGYELGIGALMDPSDLFIDAFDRVWVVDTANARILQLDHELHLLKVITEVYDESGEAYVFTAPKGIYVHENGVYLADTGAKRILHFNEDCRLIRIIGEPSGSVFSDSFDYKPTKLLVDTAERIFVISNGFNQGVIELDKNGDFVACLGAPEVQVTLVEYFRRLVSTREQIDRSISFVPTEYNNINIDSDDFIYVTASSFSALEYQNGTAQSVKKLNAKGRDILRKAGNANPYGDTKYMATGSYRGASTIVDVAPIEYGMYSILDSKRCRVFVYNADGEMLFEFGSPGSVKGTFRTPIALDYCDGSFFILDSGKRSITKYTLNRYGRMLHDATMHHYLDDYDMETALWQKIAAENNNHLIAMAGLGKAAYRTGEFSKAMDYFEIAGDRDNYSRAFKMYRQQRLSVLIPYIIVGLVVVYLFLCVRKYFVRNKSSKAVNPHTFLSSLRYSLTMIVHPLSGSWDLKKEHYGKPLTGTIILLGASVAFGVNGAYSGFIFRGVQEANFFLLCLGLLLPILLYCVCSWCVTSMMDGEGTFKEIVMAAGYSTTPILILYPIATLLSHVITMEESMFFGLFVTLAIGWTLMLLVCSTMEIHDYSMSKTLLVVFITVVVMVIVVLLAVLVFALVDQFIVFLTDLTTEISLR